MSVTIRRMACTPEELFAVLSDPWVYPTWVVGASRLRDADGSYPEPGARLHHSIGVWPLVLNDETRVELWDPPRRVILEAKTRPFGTERVVIEAQRRGSGCVVRMEEEPATGLVTRIPGIITETLLRFRNAETLRRLEWVARGRARNEGRAVRAGSSPRD